MSTAPRNHNGKPHSPRHPRAVPADARAHARAVADAVVAAWHRVDGTGRLDIPMATVASLALLKREEPDADRIAEALVDSDPDGFWRFTRWVWTRVINHRPEVTHLLYPMIGWIFEPAAEQHAAAVHAVAQAATLAGQLELTGTDRRFEVDLLGTLLIALRPQAGIQRRGQFYTPPEVAKLSARMLDIPEHASVTDPMMGTGGMFRVVAEVLREQGRDPRTVRWVGCDIDEIAVAAATVNTLIWDLGADIVFHAGDTFTPDWTDHALAQRDELRTLAAGIRRDKALIDLLKHL